MLLLSFHLRRERRSRLVAIIYYCTLRPLIACYNRSYPNIQHKQCQSPAKKIRCVFAVHSIQFSLNWWVSVPCARFRCQTRCPILERRVTYWNTLAGKPIFHPGAIQFEMSGFIWMARNPVSKPMLAYLMSNATALKPARSPVSSGSGGGFG
jgi:hypothetical protein